MNVSMDKMGRMSNQLTDNDLFECTALSTTDIAGNIFGRLLLSDFTYAATNFLAGTPPGIDPQGADPWTAIQSAIAYGLLPQENATFTALTTSELYTSQWSNYPLNQRTVALQHVMAGGKRLGKDYDAVVAYMKSTGWGVMLYSTWYQSFMYAPGGVLPAPAGGTSAHAPTVYLNDEGQMVIKPLIGSTWGDGGYAVLTRDIFNQIVSDSVGFDPNGIRWYSLVGILITKFPFLVEFTSNLLTIDQTMPNIENTDTMYPDWIGVTHVRHNLRVICDEMGLSPLQKDCATDICSCESGFNPHAKLINNPTSIDRGLFQWNGLHHPEITDIIAYDPEQNARLACKAILAGKMHEYWSASEHCWNRTGKYNSLLGK